EGDIAVAERKTNYSPTIERPNDQVLAFLGFVELPLIIGDDQTAIGKLRIDAFSSNPDLVGGLFPKFDGTNWSLVVWAGRDGTGTVTVQVTDEGYLSTSAAFNLRVLSSGASSPFELDPSQIAFQPGGLVSLSLIVPIGMRFAVEASTDLKSWDLISDRTATN